SKELAQIKRKLKQALAKSLRGAKKGENASKPTSEAMETFSTLVKGTKTDQDKAAFSDCVIESIITMSRDIIPERVYQAFKNFKEAIQEQVEVDQKDLH